MSNDIGKNNFYDGGVVPSSIVLEDVSNLAPSYVVKDSGAREEFSSGAKRDVQEGKPRYDLIPPLALKRVATLYARGLEKYGEDNWSKGMPFRRFYASMLRHAMQYGAGDKDEDHLAAVIFNALSIIHFQEAGRTDLDDMPKWTENKKD